MALVSPQECPEHWDPSEAREMLECVCVSMCVSICVSVSACLCVWVYLESPTDRPAGLGRGPGFWEREGPRGCDSSAHGSMLSRLDECVSDCAHDGTRPLRTHKRTRTSSDRSHIGIGDGHVAVPLPLLRKISGRCLLGPPSSSH